MPRDADWSRRLPSNLAAWVCTTNNSVLILLSSAAKSTGCKIEEEEDEEMVETSYWEMKFLN